MEIDDIVEVPDTPDRYNGQMTNERGRAVKDWLDSSFSMSNPLAEQHLFEEGTKNRPMVIESGSKKPPLRNPRFSTSSSSLAQSNKTKVVTEKNSLLHTRDTRSRSSPSLNVDPPQRNPHKSLFREKSGLVNGVSNSNGSRKKSNVLGKAGEGTSNMSKVGFVGNVESRSTDWDFLSRDPIAPPRVNKHKRLVRNGCISPNNVVKSNQLSGKDRYNSQPVIHTFTTNSDGANVSMETDCQPASVDIMDLVAEDTVSYKGKGKAVLSPRCLSREADFANKHLRSRSSLSFNEKPMGTNDYSMRVDISTEEPSEWISTRSRSKNMDPPDDEQLFIQETNAPGPGLHRDQRTRRRGKEISVPTTAEFSPTHLNLVSSEHTHAQAKHLMQSEADRKARVERVRSAATAISRRHRHPSTSSSLGECSTSVSDDPDVVLLSSSAEPSNSYNANNLQPVNEVNELSPELRRDDGFDERERARQLEADENLARELQEQLYNEAPVFGDEEYDSLISRAMEHHTDEFDHVVSRAPNTSRRGSLVANLRRQSQARTTSSARRGSPARAYNPGRTTRSRGRFPGQPRSLALPSRGRSSIFPADMDIETRIHLLGEMEAFNIMGMPPAFLQNRDDFNEDDYEMLLALDENNDQHSGASVHHINGLPQSTVQNDNFQEPCAVCLETPSIGDTIRHLPCLHKFHKDCIDPWLRRKTSCPICKSSIT